MAGRTVEMSISGFGSGATCFFRHNSLDGKDGIVGASVSNEGLRLVCRDVPSSSDLFLGRKGFILTAALVV